MLIQRGGAEDAEKGDFMKNFFSKHSGKLKVTFLILMLLIPFFLFAAAMHGSAFQVNFFLALMAGNMLFVMIKG
jgi:hypothetical protein